MNKNYTSILVLMTMLFFGVLSAQETQKNFINYQGVARGASNELMVGEAMTIGVALKFGAADGSVVYAEDHNVTTDANGVFSLLIGNGNATQGNYNSLPWGSAATFVTVSVNGSEIGTTEMMAVPYAISAGNTSDQSAAEVSYDNSTSGLSATNAQAAIDELITGSSADADADPSNELQLLSFDAATNELSLSEGNSVTIPSGGADADADPENELQTLSFNAVTNTLSLSDGNTVTIPSGGTDADADPSNELQDISLSGTELTISEGSTIDLAPIVPSGGTDNQELTFNATTKVLAIEDGNTVDLSTLSGGMGSSLWEDNEFGLYRPNGVVNLGHIPSADADSKFFVFSSTPGVRSGIRSYVIHSGYKVGVSANALSRDGENTFGMRSSTTSESTGPAWAYRADMTGSGTGAKYAFYSRIPEGTGGVKYGLYTDGEDKNYISGDLGIGTDDPTAKIHVRHSSDIASPQMRLEDSDVDYARLEFKNSAQGFWHIAGRGGETGDQSRLNFYHHNGTSGRDYMTIAGSGSVGIGTTSPAAKLDVAGDINTSGELTRNSTGDANLVPIAYGTVRGTGVIASGSGNFSVNKTSAGNYRITIAGESYFFANYTTIASLISGPGFIHNSSVSGTLTVSTYNTSGTPTDAIFTFVAYKP